MLRRAALPVALSVLLLFILLLNKLGVLAPDIKPEIYMAPWREAEALSRAWRESPKLGEPNFNVGLFPVAWVVGVIQSLGIGADLSMRLLRWALLLVGAWGASRLYTEVAGRQSHRVGRIAMAVTYVANPYMVTAGDFLANVLPAAMLPWMALFLLRAAVRGGWRYPAAAALSFAAMSGMNAAVIPLIQLLCLPAVLWFAHSGLGATWRQVTAATIRWVLLVGLLSAYWLAPSLAALGAGSHVTQFSESLAGIAGSTSFAEVLRGVGLWTLYGRDIDGPWQPGFSSYVTNPAIVVATFVLPILLVVAARFVRGPGRRLALFLTLPAAVLMVGVHPPDRPSPFGSTLLWTFEHIPGAAAFRTTHKVGAVLVLGIALLIALAMPELVRKARQLVPRPFLAAAVAGGVVVITWPAWTGGLYSLPLPVPDYWYEASQELDKGPMDRRVWFVPGVAQPQYTWSEDRPDDLNNALLARPSFVRITLPESSPYGASLLAAVDTGLQEGTLPTGALTTAARYLGVGDVLVRHDVRWDKSGGGRPLSVATSVGSEPDLAFRGAYGDPGEGLIRTPHQPEDELTLPPLQHYEVLDGRNLVRTESQAGAVLVDGDGWALAPLVQAGLLADEPPFLYTGSLDPATVTELLGPTSRIVLTDTNRRRVVTPNRLTSAYGALLAPDQDPGPSIALLAPEDQTVLHVEGGVVSASQVGAKFGVDPASSAENAFDRDPTTAWRFGDFGEALGQWVSVRTPRPVPVERIDVDIPPTTGQRIAAVEIRADDQIRQATVPADGRVSVTFPGQQAQQITLTVTDVEGVGDNPVFVADIAVPELQVRRVATLPTSTVRAVQNVTGSARERLSSTPVDLVFTRVQGLAASSADDEEARLDRDFTLPQSREYRIYGLVKPDEAAPDELLDSLYGVTGDAVVRSSSRAFHNVAVRGSMAFDGNPLTGWMPGRAVVGEWIEASLVQPRTISEIVIEQSEESTGWISGVEVSLDGRPAATADLSPGRVVIDIPESDVSTVRIRATDVEGSGVPVINEIGIADTRVVSNPEPDPDRCIALDRIDGSQFRARVIAGDDPNGLRLIAGCETIQLRAGEHRLRSVPGWTADTLVLRDTQGEAAVPGRPGPAVTVDRKSSSAYRVVADAATEPYFLIVGQNVHPGWTATMDGTDLGPPMVVDGYALGWWVTDLDPHEFEIHFSPQRVSDIGKAISAGAVLLTLGLLLLPGRSQRLPAPTRVEPSPALPQRGLIGPQRTGRLIGWLLLVFGCWFFAGLPGLAIGATVAVAVILRKPTSRTVFRLAAVSMSLAPAAWIIGNLHRWGEIGPDLVLRNPAPSLLVVTSLTLLVVATWRDVDLPRSGPEGDEHSTR
ncbi:MAG TPA: DUF3367 domain-containing protein [Intrasporangiaceae bacterium]|nr:DUF3367 domain-containing protein [Intrasporangiaceae bacterium]